MEKNQLLNRVWNSKKSRMNAEARLIALNFYASFFLSYYGVTFLCFQLSSKFFPQSVFISQIDWMATSSSLVVMVFSIIVGSQDLKNKSRDMKKCYVELSEAEEIIENGSLDDGYRKYNEIMKKYDNHLVFDYWKINLFKKLNSSESGFDCGLRHTIYFLYKLLSYVVPLTLFLVPIIVFVKYIYPSL